MPYVLTEKGATIILDGRAHMITSDHALWSAIKASIDNDIDLRRLLTAGNVFQVGDRWRTRSGGEAEIVSVADNIITALIDDCIEVETLAGRVSPGTDLDDDLIEKI